MKRLHFLTANGFPKALYRPVIAKVEQAIQAKSGGLVKVSSAATDVFPYVRENEDWSGMINAVIKDVEARKEGPVVGVGHSLGGALVGAAAAARPDLFSSLVMIDAPLFHPLYRLVISSMCLLPKKFVYKFHPMILAAHRKPDHWSSREEAEAYLRSKRLFSRLDSEILKIFVEECLVPRIDGEPGVSLLWPTSAEAEIYYFTPCDLPGHPRKNMRQSQFTMPATMLHSDSDSLLSCRDIWWLHRTAPQIETVQYHGGHFWCLEQPNEFADYLAELLLAKH